jgi:hypothetical protein
VRPEDLVSALRNGRPLEAGDRSALVIGGTGKIRTGGTVVFLKVVAVAPAQVRRDGRVQGSPWKASLFSDWGNCILLSRYLRFPWSIRAGS